MTTQEVKGSPQARATVQKTLEHWVNNSDLVSVRRAKSLQELPPSEREAWQKLWADVYALLERARQGK
jgi:hypothetical protein